MRVHKKKVYDANKYSRIFFKDSILKNIFLKSQIFYFLRHWLPIYIKNYYLKFLKNILEVLVSISQISFTKKIIKQFRL